MLAALLAVATATVEPVDAEREPGTHIAFVGERVSVQEMNPCFPDEAIAPGTSLEEACRGEPLMSIEEGNPDVIVMRGFNRIFEARYRVVESLAGELRTPEIAFRIADHYGTPGFTELRHALLVVTLDDGDVYLQKYMGFGAYRVAGGGWATCGSSESGARTPPAARPLTFLEPIRDLRDEDPADIALWRADPDLRIDGGQLYCARGVPLDEYLDYLRGGVLKARGVVLEPAPAKP